jgi:oligopeptide transport system substrate-binding protein
VLAACLLAPAAAQAEFAPAEQQKLTVNIGHFPTSLDPAKVSREQDFIVQNALFAPLYRSPGGSAGTLVPFLASGQPVVTNGGRTWTVTLRAAKWSDGKAITSADVKFAYGRSRASALGAFFDVVTSVQTPSLRTVRLQLSRPVPWFDQLLATNVVTPVPAHAVKLHRDKWLLPKNIVSSGPFRLESTRGSSEIVLVKNERFWNAKSVRLQRLKLLMLPPASAATLFDAKRIDAGTRDTSIPRYQLATRSTKPTFRRVASGGGEYLFLNTRATELANPATRRGIALAIDRAALAQVTGPSIDQPLESIVPNGVRGFNTVAPAGSTLLASSGAADTTSAKAQLAAGAWPAASKFDLYYANVDATPTLAGKIADNLNAVGVSVSLHPLTMSVVTKVGVGAAPVRADVDGVIAGWQPDYSDPQDFHELFTCAAIDHARNLSNYCDATGYDATYTATTGTFAPFATRVNGHRQLEDLLTGPNGAMPAVPLYEPTGDYLVQPYVAGFVVQPSGLVDFEKVSIRLATS